MSVNYQDAPGCRVATWPVWQVGRTGVSDRHGVFDMQFARPAIVKDAKRCVAPLLNFCNYEACADGVDCSSRHKNNVIFHDRVPLNELRNRPLADCLPQLILGDSLCQSNGDFAVWFGRKDVPGLRFSAWQSNRP